MKHKFLWLILVLAGVLAVVLLGIALDAFIKSRNVSSANSCLNNLRQLDGAKQQWALSNQKPMDAVPTKDDLLPYLRQWVVCPHGGTYTIGPVSEPPKCSIPGDKLP